MRIAVYTIAKNEEQFVQRWARSCEDADYRLILDTGSTDKTCTMAGIYGVTHHQRIFDPWRFDHARNYALSLVPDDIDICIALDMDEILVEGWREALEKIASNVTRPRYKYVWSWNKDGNEGLVYGGDKIHARHNYVWKHPVHEVLRAVGILEQQSWVDGLEIHHFPDASKSRAQYLPLLELAVEEDPEDDRNQFYLAREYFFRGDTVASERHFVEHFRLSRWSPERAANRRYMAKLNPSDAEMFLYQAIAEAPNRREAWIDLAMFYYYRNDWESCRASVLMALRIKEKPLEYLCEAQAWGSTPYDLLALASYHLGDPDTAVINGRIAADLNPDDDRLRRNLDWYVSQQKIKRGE